MSQRRAATRRAILEQARAHAIRFGWRRARVRDIAADTGISRPTLYKEFPSKDDLGEALLVHEMTTFLHRLDETVRSEGAGAHERIRGAMAFALSEADRNPLLATALAEAGREEGSLLPGLASGRTDVIALATAAVAAMLVEDAPGVAEADLEFVATLTVRLAVSFLVVPPPEDRDALARRVADMCVGYLSA